MIYEVSNLAIIIFLFIVGLVLGLSFYFARKTKSASSYYAAGGKIHWAVNGIAFAGDYLSAASFLGICGMIAYSGYDGFLYSIGYLAGWVVALFLVAEPLKKLGKYTFTDALGFKIQFKAYKTCSFNKYTDCFCFLSYPSDGRCRRPGCSSAWITSLDGSCYCRFNCNFYCCYCRYDLNYICSVYQRSIACYFFYHTYHLYFKKRIIT